MKSNANRGSVPSERTCSVVIPWSRTASSGISTPGSTSCWVWEARYSPPTHATAYCTIRASSGSELVVSRSNAVRRRCAHDAVMPHPPPGAARAPPCTPASRGGRARGYDHPAPAAGTRPPSLPASKLQSVCERAAPLRGGPGETSGLGLGVGGARNSHVRPLHVTVDDPGLGRLLDRVGVQLGADLAVPGQRPLDLRGLRQPVEQGADAGLLRHRVVVLPPRRRVRRAGRVPARLHVLPVQDPEREPAVCQPGDGIPVADRLALGLAALDPRRTVHQIRLQAELVVELVALTDGAGGEVGGQRVTPEQGDHPLVPQLERRLPRRRTPTVDLAGDEP